MQVVRSLFFIGALALAPATVSAAPPPLEADTCECETEVAAQDCTLVTGRQLFSSGHREFERGNFAEAIMLWEKLLILLPSSQHGSVRVSLAHAYHQNYATSRDTQDLLDASRLLHEQRAETAEDQPFTRAELEQLVAEVDAELAEVEAERARIEAERIAAIREQEAAKATTVADTQWRKADRIRLPLEVSGAALGAGITVMGAVVLSQDGKCLNGNTDVTTCPAVRESTLSGVATLTAGGALFVSSMILLAVDITRRRKRKKDSKPAVAFAPGGILRF